MFSLIVYQHSQNEDDHWKEIYNNSSNIINESNKCNLYNLGRACIDLGIKYYSDICNSIIINDKVISLFLTPDKSILICCVGERYYDISRAYGDYVDNFIEFDIQMFIECLIN